MDTDGGERPEERLRGGPAAPAPLREGVLRDWRWRRARARPPAAPAMLRAGVLEQGRQQLRARRLKAPPPPILWLLGNPFRWSAAALAPLCLGFAVGAGLLASGLGPAAQGLVSEGVRAEAAATAQVEEVLADLWAPLEAFPRTAGGSLIEIREAGS